MTMNKLHLPVLFVTLTLIVTSDCQTRQITAQITDGLFGQFRGVSLQSVWEQVQNRKTVSFSVVRDTAQFLVVNLAWLTAGLVLWRGPAVSRGDTRTPGHQALLQENVSHHVIDIKKLNNFFSNPNVVARNLFVCTSLVTITPLLTDH